MVVAVDACVEHGHNSILQWLVCTSHGSVQWLHCMMPTCKRLAAPQHDYSFGMLHPCTGLL